MSVWFSGNYMINQDQYVFGFSSVCCNKMVRLFRNTTYKILRMRNLTATLFLTLAVLLGSAGMSWAQTTNPKDMATLYRNSLVIENERMHIATFDSSIKAWGGTVFSYNWENCMNAAKLFQEQPGVKTRF